MNRQLTISEQAAKIKRDFKVEVQTNKGIRLVSRMFLKSSPLGSVYEIKLIYSMKQAPQVFVLSPKPLPMYAQNTKLPHTYDTEKQRLCLYYPDGKEWNRSCHISETIIPWTIEWLFHYEIWAKTGVWTGGGKH